VQNCPGSSGFGNFASVRHSSIWRTRILFSHSLNRSSMQRDFSA
jgi:hypothetical protein